jgi:hypothetical protein
MDHIGAVPRGSFLPRLDVARLPLTLRAAHSYLPVRAIFRTLAYGVVPSRCPHVFAHGRLLRLALLPNGLLGLAIFAHASVNLTSQFLVPSLLLLLGYTALDPSLFTHFPLPLLSIGFAAGVGGFFFLRLALGKPLLSGQAPATCSKIDDLP